jgi:hypothetical protein
MYVCMYGWMDIYTYIYIYTHTHTDVYIIYVSVCVCVCVFYVYNIHDTSMCIRKEIAFLLQ